MPDARGHGNSSAPRNGYSYEDHAGDVLGLIRLLGLDTPVLLGHSMGGMTAALAASRAGAAIRGLVLADPTFLCPQRQREVFDSDVIEQHHRLLSANREEVLAQARLRHPRRSLEIVQQVIKARLQTRIDAFEVLIPPNPDYRQLVNAVGVPTLLVIGDTSSVVSLETARELQSLNPRIQLEQVQDAGHGLPYDQPERFAALVRSFLHPLFASPAKA